MTERQMMLEELKKELTPDTASRYADWLDANAEDEEDLIHSEFIRVAVSLQSCDNFMPVKDVKNIIGVLPNDLNLLSNRYLKLAYTETFRQRWVKIPMVQFHLGFVVSCQMVTRWDYREELKHLQERHPTVELPSIMEGYTELNMVTRPEDISMDFPVRSIRANFDFGPVISHEPGFIIRGDL